MKKILITILVISLIVIIGIIFKDINIKESFASLWERNSRFKNSQGYSPSEITEIIIDKETGVMYLWVENNYKGGLTLMVDKEGKPLLYED